MKMDEYERDLLDSIEREEWQPVPGMDEAIAEAARIAMATTSKDQRMNIRLTRKDLQALKARAMEEGLPYQSLVTSILHKYLSGKLVEREERKRAS